MGGAASIQETPGRASPWEPALGNQALSWRQCTPYVPTWPPLEWRRDGGVQRWKWAICNGLNLNLQEVLIHIFPLQGTIDIHSFYSAHLPLTFFATLSLLVSFFHKEFLTPWHREAHTHITTISTNMCFQNLCRICYYNLSLLLLLLLCCFLIDGKESLFFPWRNWGQGGKVIYPVLPRK